MKIKITAACLVALSVSPAFAADPATIDRSRIPAVHVGVFYPGQSSYQWVRSDAHKGAASKTHQPKFMWSATKVGYKSISADQLRKGEHFPIREKTQFRSTRTPAGRKATWCPTTS